jgi:putative membrane protein insertion efficiency factor
MNVQSTGMRVRLPERAAVALVRFYQRFLSGLKPPTCRFYPTCSEYGLQAIAHRGLIRGCLLAAWRLLRCNPFSSGGYDPDPSPVAAADRRSPRR